MLGLQFEFLARRYHATPWGHQVNEGQVAWPPSPWRLLRALIAGWYRLDEAGSEPLARRLVEKLAESDPVFWLPPHTEAHTRHYMPTDNKPTLVFDAFLQFGEQSTMGVGFPGVELDGEERDLLERCVEQLSYLGRAESWVVATVTDAPQSHGVEVRPGRVPGGRDLLGAMAASEYADWARGVRASTTKKAERPPPDLWGALTMGTDAHQKGRWSGPPGSRRIAYDVRDVRPRTARMPERSASLSGRVARFALVADEGVLPRFQQGLLVAEAFHAALAKKASDHGDVQLLTGKKDGAPLQDEGHAYLVWTAGRGPGAKRVTHVHVALPHYRPGGEGERATHAFSRDEEATFARLRTLRLFLPGRGDGPTSFRLVLEGLWSAHDLEQLRYLDRAPPALHHAQDWISETPVVLFRHPKVRDGRFIKDAPTEQVKAYLERAGFPAAEVRLCEEQKSWARFRRRRKDGRGGVGAWGFELRFDEPVAGPIALGAMAHLGMGRFRPA